MAVYAVGPMVVLLLSVAVIVLVLIAVARRGRRAGVVQPSCGKCGYAVEGLESLRCPECGSDLRQVGIVTPEMRRPIPPLLIAIIWTILLPIPALLLTSLVAAALPENYVSTATITFSSPMSGAYPGVTLIARRVGAPPPAKAYETTSIHWRLPDGGVLRADVDLATMRATPEADSDGERAAAFDVDDIDQWLEANGIAVDEPVAMEIQEILTQLRVFKAGSSGVSSGRFSGVSSSASTNLLPHRWFGPVALAFWLAIWIAGVALIFRSARRVRSAAA